MWERGTMEQLFSMAESSRKVRREELRELIYVAHGDPKAFLQDLREVGLEQNGMLALAQHLGDQKAVERMETNLLAKKFLDAEKNRG